MEVSISNFRCYYRNNPTVYYFPTGLCHLTGESGAGKSTIIMAIEWCLYGKNSGIKPRGKNTLVPEVTIRFENFFGRGVEEDHEGNDVVLERKSPNFITVFLPNNVSLNADAAQGWINQNFGSRDLWMATSCLFQGTRNIILSGTGEEKFKILRELTYGSDVGDLNDPDWYLQKLRDSYKELSKNCDSLRTKYEAFYDYLEPILDSFETNNNWDPVKESITNIQESIKRTTIKLSESRKIWSDYKSSQALRESLEKNIEKFPDDIDSQISKFTLEVESLTTKLVEINSQGSLRKLKERVVNTLTVDSQIHKYQYNPKLYKSLYDRLVQRQNYIKACEKYSLPTDLENLQKWEDELLSLVKYREDLSSYEASAKQIRERTDLEKKLDVARRQLIDGVTTNSDELDSMMVSMIKEKSELNSSLMSLKSKVICPNCNVSIILNNSKGIQESMKTFKPEDEQNFKERLEEITEALADINVQISSVQTVNNLQSRLESFKCEVGIVEVPEMPVIKYLNVIAKKNPVASLQNCKVLQEQFVEDLSPTDQDLLLELKLGNDLKDLILDSEVSIEELLEKDFNSDGVSAIETKRSLEMAKNSLQKYKDLASNRKALISQLASISHIEPKSQLPEFFEDQLNEYNLRLEQGKEFEKIKKENNQLIQKKEQLDIESAKVVTMANLIDIVKRVSLQPMEDVISAINTVTNNILEELYDSPINVLLSVFRNQDDSKTASKMSVNIQIFYGEEAYPNISNLSGGEADRVSLALTLALAKLHHSPMLIFDECMASLNCDYREKCMKVIKDTLTDSSKTVFDICHESVEGYHDTIVPISKF